MAEYVSILFLRGTTTENKLISLAEKMIINEVFNEEIGHDVCGELLQATMFFLNVGVNTVIYRNKSCRLKENNYVEELVWDAIISLSVFQ